MKKVCFIIPHLGLGGAQKIASFVMNNYVNYGISVSCVSYCKKEEHIFLETKVNRYNIFNDNYELEKNIIMKIINRLYLILKLKKIFYNIQPDYIINFGPNPWVFFSYILFSNKIKLISCERGYLGERNRIYSFLCKLIMKMSSVSVFQFEGAMVDYGKWIPKNSIIIHNPIIKLHEKIEYQLTNKIVSFGRFVNEKGFDMLIKAFKIVSDSNNNAILEIYGDGPEKENLENLIINLSLKNKVFIKKTVFDSYQILKNAQIFVLSSNYEGLPNALIEAMELGIPVVSTNCLPGGAEFLTKNGTVGGYIVNRGDHIEMANKILYLLDNPEKAKYLGMIGRKRIIEFDKDKIIREWINLII